MQYATPSIEMMGRENAKLNGQLLSTIFTAIGTILLVASQLAAHRDGMWALLASSFGSTLLTAGIVSIGIELRLSRYRSLENAILVDRVNKSVSSLLNRQLNGVERVVMDMTQDIDWRECISNASEMVVCWWSGRGWLKLYLPIIREVAQQREIAMVVIMPDIKDASITTEMTKQSGISRETLLNAHDEVLEILKSVHNLNLTIRYIHRTPPYIYMRMGDLVAFKLYPNNSIHHQQMPMFTCSRHSKLGDIIERDVENTYR